jgi:hypothetical protein
MLWTKSGHVVDEVWTCLFTHHLKAQTRMALHLSGCLHVKRRLGNEYPLWHPLPTPDVQLPTQLVHAGWVNAYEMHPLNHSYPPTLEASIPAGGLLHLLTPCRLLGLVPEVQAGALPEPFNMQVASWCRGAHYPQQIGPTRTPATTKHKSQMQHSATAIPNT